MIQLLHTTGLLPDLHNTRWSFSKYFCYGVRVLTENLSLIICVINQKQANLSVCSLKRINTVRWSAREYCLDMFLKRYETVIQTVNTVASDKKFDAEKRSLADGMRVSFMKKQFMATAYLFRDIFSITGPLSRTLQSVNIDFGKALNLLDVALKQLADLRDSPKKILEEIDNEFDGIEWEQRRTVRRKRMAGELVVDEPANS